MCCTKIQFPVTSDQYNQYLNIYSTVCCPENLKSPIFKGIVPYIYIYPTRLDFKPVSSSRFSGLFEKKNADFPQPICVREPAWDENAQRIFSPLSQNHNQAANLFYPLDNRKKRLREGVQLMFSCDFPPQHVSYENWDPWAETVIDS